MGHDSESFGFADNVLMLLYSLAISVRTGRGRWWILDLVLSNLISALDEQVLELVGNVPTVSESKIENGVSSLVDGHLLIPFVGVTTKEGHRR